MLPDSSQLIVFFTAAIVLLVVPGPAVMYIVARSIHQGRLAGFVSTLGIGTGSLVHVVAAALGISAILMRSAMAFTVLKYIGAAYLVYLGIRKLAEREETAGVQADRRESLRTVFVQGIWVNLLNPKTALFFFAFLPQFVDPARGTPMVQIVVLGTVFVALGVASDGVYALLAGTVGNVLRRHPKVLGVQRWFAGAVYVALGVVTAMSGGSRGK